MRRAVAAALSPVTRAVIVVAEDTESALAAEALAEQDRRVQVVCTVGCEGAPLGAGAARNRGLGEVRAEWVTFCDADDEYAPGYLEALNEMVTGRSSLALVHTNLVRVERDAGGAVIATHDNHPLRARFSRGNQVFTLADFPQMIGTSVAAAAFPVQGLRATGVQFSESLNWSEDADFIVRYLLETEANGDAACVGLCAQATYRYTVNTGATLTQSAWENPKKYVLPFEQLYLRWVALCADELPLWLQNIMLYELYWYIEADRAVFHPSHDLPAEVKAQCVQLMSEVISHISARVIAQYALTPLSLDRRMMLTAWCKEATRSVVSDTVISYMRASWQPSQKYTYFYTGELPTEEFLTSTHRVRPTHQRWVSHTLFDHEMVRERVLWFEEPIIAAIFNQHYTVAAPFAGYPKLQIPGRPVITKIPQRSSAQPALLARARIAFWHLRKSRWKQIGPPPATRTVEQRETWFYMDRAHRAGDNAEALYRYAAGAMPHIKHIFALNSTSDDWQRLNREGFNLVDAGDSQAFTVAMQDACELLVSDISDAVLSPALRGLSKNQRLVFLQHGITRTPVWRWLNPRRIDVMITTHESETQRIIGNGSNYTLSAPEIWQTGMPRLDRLIALRRAEAHRDVLLIAPTWVPSLRASTDPP